MLRTAISDAIVVTYHGSCARSTITTVVALSTAPLGYSHRPFRYRRGLSERTRDKMSAVRRKGKWIGGHPVLGYDIDPKGGRIIVNPAEAEQVRTIFGVYMAQGSLLPALQETEQCVLDLSQTWRIRLQHRAWVRLP